MGLGGGGGAGAVGDQTHPAGDDTMYLQETSQQASDCVREEGVRDAASFHARHEAAQQ